MISQLVSIDIVKFLQKEGYSKNEIAQILDTPVSFVDEIIRGKKTLSDNHIINIKQNTDITLTVLLTNAIPEEHIPDRLKERFEKIRARAEIIQDLQKRIKKKQ